MILGDKWTPEPSRKSKSGFFEGKKTPAATAKTTKAYNKKQRIFKQIKK